MTENASDVIIHVAQNRDKNNEQLMGELYDQELLTNCADDFPADDLIEVVREIIKASELRRKS